MNFIGSVFRKTLYEIIKNKGDQVIPVAKNLYRNYRLKLIN